MKRGFTLLELLISCALLLVVLGVLSTVISRVNTLRRDGINRTTLLTKGRAALDIVADDIQNVVGTNLTLLVGEEWDMAEQVGSITNVGLHLVRTISHPRGNPSEASNPPIAGIYYQVVTTNEYSPNASSCFLYRGHVPYTAGEDPTSTNIGEIVTSQPGLLGATYDVTNVVAGMNTTVLPPAQVGDTIQLPVNSVSSTRIYDWTTSTHAWVDVVPTANSNVNRAVATVIFSNAFTSVSVYTNTPAMTNLPTGFWPETPQTTVSTGYQAIAFILTNNSTVSTDVFTNGLPVVTNEISFATNILAGAEGLFTNTLPVNATNLIDIVTQATFTNDWQVFYQEDSLPPQYTNTFVGVRYGWTNLPINTVSNAWTLPPDTNAVDGVQGSTATYDWGRWDTVINPTLTNLPWRVGVVTNVNVFTNNATADPRIENLPLSLHATNVFVFAINGEAYETMSTNFSIAVAHGDTLAPIQTQVYGRVSETISTNKITAENLIVTLRQRVWLVTTNILETSVPATLLATNHYRYADQAARRDWIDTIRYEDTVWMPHTLIEDYGGGTAEVLSLWLNPGTKTATSITYVPTTISSWIGRPHTEGARSPNEIIDGVAAFHCQPLRFVRDGEDDPWRLAIWSPGDAEPPACIDLYLEILDPRAARRAAAMNETQREAFIQRNAVRLSRRVPLKTYNRWRAP